MRVFMAEKFTPAILLLASQNPHRLPAPISHQRRSLMVGLIQLMIYLLSIYLVFKGAEIFQIAFMSSRENRFYGMGIGLISILVAIGAGVIFSVWATWIAVDITNKLNAVPTLPGLR
jgi:hypothetical protein